MTENPMLPTLRVLLGVLGVSAILICGSIMILGPGATAVTAERAFDAPFWGAYGILLLAVARDIARLGRWVPWLAAVFFAGGVGRAVSWLAVGPPHPFFVTLMAIELLTPPVLIILWRAAGR
jgi:Domain of unknown function (DUF4345)